MCLIPSLPSSCRNLFEFIVLSLPATFSESLFLFSFLLLTSTPFPCTVYTPLESFALSLFQVTFSLLRCNVYHTIHLITLPIHKYSYRNIRTGFYIIVTNHLSIVNQVKALRPWLTNPAETFTSLSSNYHRLLLVKSVQVRELRRRF